MLSLQRTIASSPSTPSIASYQDSTLFDPPPPVPAIPKHAMRSSSSSGDSDVFSTPLSTIKGLDSSHGRSSQQSEVSDNSIVLVNNPLREVTRSPSPTTTVRERPSSHTKAASRSKRRSMSVSDAELAKAIAASSSSGAMRSSTEGKRFDAGWESSLNGIISDFRGELLQLDPVSSSFLDLQDPTTPSRRLPQSRSQSDRGHLSDVPPRPPPKPTTSLPALAPTPAVTLQSVSGDEESILDVVLSSPTEESSSQFAPPIVPPRKSSLGPPVRTRSGSGSVAQPRITSLKYGPRSPPQRYGSSSTHAHSPSRESNRLRVQHRSTASNSEPSLVPEREDGRVREHVRTVRVVASANPVIPPETGSPLSAMSQQDLTSHDLARTRFALQQSTSSKAEESADLDARGKELASRCWAEDEEFLAKDKIAEWLGGQ